MLLPQGPYGIRREQSVRRTAGQDEILDERPEGAAQPLADRYLEPPLRATKDLGGHEIGDGLPQDHLGAPIADLPVRGQRGGELDEVLIEQWAADFEAFAMLARSTLARMSSGR